MTHDDTPTKKQDRGQLLVLAAILIAVTMIGMATLVSSGVQNERLQSEPTLGELNDIRDAEYVTRRVAGSTMIAVNDANYGAGANAQYQSQMADVSTQLSRNTGQAAGSNLELEVTGVQEGDAIRQDSSAELTDVSGGTSWHLGDFDAVRRFMLTTQRNELPEISTANVDSAVVLRGNAFYVTFLGPSTEVRVYLFRSNSDVYLATQVGGGPVTAESIDAFDLNIELMTGSVNQQKLVEFPTELGDNYDVFIRNGDEVEAQWVAVTDGTPDSGNIGNSPGDTPYEIPAVYSADVTVTRVTPESQSTMDLTIAPCDRDSYVCHPYGEAGG